MSVELLSSEAAACEPSPAGRYVAGLGGEVSRHMANVAARVALLKVAGHALPVTIDDGGYGRSYVSSPHSAYVLYARQEIDLVGLGAMRGPALGAVALLDRVLRAAEVNRVVHLDNWLLSTNLHGDWDGAGLPEARRRLVEEFPGHLLVIRSLDAWASPKLLAAVAADGWVLLPARQIWVVDDLARDWRPRNNYANDRRAVAASGLTLAPADPFDEAEAARVAELYRQLYVERYSELNPVFTPAYIRMTQAIGLIDYELARRADGTIMAVSGTVTRSGFLTPPVVGYDTGAPRSEALYRVACWMFSRRALSQGLKLHGSAGAGDFKRRRGARGEIEYMAVYVKHLQPGRRAAVRGLAALLQGVAAPVMRRQGW